MEILILMTIGVIVVAGVITYLSGRNHELSLRWNEMSLRKKLTLRTGTDARWGSVQSLSKLLDEAGFGDDQMTQKYLIRLKVMENHRYGCSDNSN